MNTENDKLMHAIVSEIIKDFTSRGIHSFGDWFKVYCEEPYDEVLKIVNNYVTKVNENKIDEIEHWEKVVMLNSVAIFMIEMDIQTLPHPDLRDKIIETFVKTIRNYKHVKSTITDVRKEVFIYRLVDSETAKA